MKKIQIKKFIQTGFQQSKEWTEVEEIAEQLHEFLSLPVTIQKLNNTNLPGRKSNEIQEIVLGVATKLGFVDESKGLFSDYKNNRLRPDYYKKIGTTTGILMEVERGKTNQNNMDFLDFWKCHICKHAHYLFLIVPQELMQNSSNKVVGRPFNTVAGHMESLFDPENYTNVHGVVLFGY